MQCTLLSVLLLMLAATYCSALPVTRQEKKLEKDDKHEAQSSAEPIEVETALEYERYLKEVVEALESDQDFRKKLDKAPEADIRSGKIAQELEYVNHQVRTKLDEIKRRELERLRAMASKQYELSNDIDRDHLKVAQSQTHVDHFNEHTFEIEDLRKLIKKTSEDLAEADRKRRAEFKEYEMQKEFERESQLKEMSEEQRKKYEHDLKEQENKHKQHDKVHHPGNKAQLEEVWEKQDHMDKEDFDPHAFFMIHDVDGNGVWDETEVKALFVKELDKVYQSGLPEDDMRERAEDMERMREHVFKETDSNHDGLISFAEFLEQTKRDEFQKDPEWETVDQQRQYTHEEYLEFERRRQEEVQNMIAQGLLPPHPNMPQGYYPDNMQQANGQHQMHYQQPNQQPMQQQAQYQQQQQQYQQQPVQLHPNQVYQQVNAQQQQQPQQHQQLPQQQQANYQQPQQPAPVPQQYQQALPAQQSQPQQANYQQPQAQQQQQQYQQPKLQPQAQYQPQQLNVEPPKPAAKEHIPIQQQQQQQQL